MRWSADRWSWVSHYNVVAPEKLRQAIKDDDPYDRVLIDASTKLRPNFPSHAAIIEDLRRIDPLLRVSIEDPPALDHGTVTSADEEDDDSAVFRHPSAGDRYINAADRSIGVIEKWFRILKRNWAAYFVSIVTIPPVVLASLWAYNYINPKNPILPPNTIEKGKQP